MNNTRNTAIWFLLHDKAAWVHEYGRKAAWVHEHGRNEHSYRYTINYCPLSMRVDNMSSSSYIRFEISRPGLFFAFSPPGVASIQATNIDNNRDY